MNETEIENSGHYLGRDYQHEKTLEKMFRKQNPYIINLKKHYHICISLSNEGIE